MASVIDCVTVDCADVERVAAFWAAALAYTTHEQKDGWIVLRDPQGVGPQLGFQRVPESKIVKNRMHLDLIASDSMVAEVARLQQLGATRVQLIQNDNEVHTVMQDPEGNEFCVVQP